MCECLRISKEDIHGWIIRKNLNRNEISCEFSDTNSFLPAVQGLVMLNWSPGLNNLGCISLSASEHHCSGSWPFGVAPRIQHHKTQVNNVCPGCPTEWGWAMSSLGHMPSDHNRLLWWDLCSSSSTFEWKQEFEMQNGKFSLHMKLYLYSSWKTVDQCSQ